MSEFQWKDIDVSKGGRLVRGIISNIDIENLTATVEGIGTEIPIHYHCEEERFKTSESFETIYPDDQDREGAYAFTSGDEVLVMFRKPDEKDPVIVGFADGIRDCVFFRFKLYGINGEVLDDRGEYNVQFWVYDQDRNLMDVTISYVEELQQWDISFNGEGDFHQDVYWVQYKYADGFRTQYKSLNFVSAFYNPDDLIFGEGEYEDTFEKGDVYIILGLSSYYELPYTFYGSRHFIWNLTKNELATIYDENGEEVSQPAELSEFDYFLDNYCRNVYYNDIWSLEYSDSNTPWPCSPGQTKTWTSAIPDVNGNYNIQCFCENTAVLPLDGYHHRYYRAAGWRTGAFEGVVPSYGGAIEYYGHIPCEDGYEECLAKLHDSCRNVFVEGTITKTYYNYGPDPYFPGDRYLNFDIEVTETKIAICPLGEYILPETSYVETYTWSKVILDYNPWVYYTYIRTGKEGVETNAVFWPQSSACTRFNLDFPFSSREDYVFQIFCLAISSHTYSGNETTEEINSKIHFSSVDIVDELKNFNPFNSVNNSNIGPMFDVAEERLIEYLEEEYPEGYATPRSICGNIYERIS